jgi:hypothetical protein
MTILFWRFLKSFFTLFYIFLHDFQDLNLGGERVAAKVVPSLEKALERSPERLLTRPHRGARGVKGMPAQVVVHHPKSLEGVQGRHLERSVLGGDLVLVEVGGAVDVNDDGVGRRHDCWLFVWYILLQKLCFYA